MVICVQFNSFCKPVCFWILNSHQLGGYWLENNMMKGDITLEYELYGGDLSVKYNHSI